MFPEVLANIDKNTELYMIDRMKKEIKRKDTALAKKDAEIERLQNLLAQYEGEGKRQ